MRAPGVWGKATTMLLVSPLPVSSRVPWMETSCGLLLHLTLGTQLTLVMRTVLTCGLEACLEVALRGTAFRTGLAAPEGAALPPALPAFACEGCPMRQHSSAEETAASANVDRWGAQFAKKLPSRRKPDCLDRRPPTLAAVHKQTEQRDRSCVNSSGSPEPRVSARVGWTAGPRGAQAG